MHSAEPAGEPLALITTKPKVIAGVSGLLTIFVVLTLGAALQKSPTADENFHLVAGYSYLRWGDFRLNPEHPPLAKILAALPLLLIQTNDEPLLGDRRDAVQVNGKYGWLLANQWLFSSNNADRLFLYARLPMVFLGLCLGIGVFHWARELYGLGGAFAALALCVFDPNMLAYAPVVHTDIPFTLALFAGSYFFWRTLGAITWFNGLMTAGCFALAAITKFSFVTILPIWGVWGLFHIFVGNGARPTLVFGREVLGRWRKVGWLTLILLSTIPFAYGTVWLAYGFSYDSIPGQRGPLLLSAAVSPSPWSISLMHLNAAHHFLPEAWVYGFIYALSTFQRTAYLLGEISGEGFWLYFPIAFVVKTPLPMLLLFLASLVFLFGRRNFAAHGRFLLLPVLLFFTFAMYSHMNIGLRHILPIYPFLFVWIGGFVATLWNGRLKTTRWAVFLVGLWLAGSTLRAYPDYLAFFNESVASDDRYKVLVDSNLDWGQELKGLKFWMGEHAVRRIQLAYFGTADPAYYGIDAIHKPGTWSVVLSKPQAGDDAQDADYIAISATHLVGLYFGPSNPYAKYLRRNPVAVIGGSIYVYKFID